MNDSLRANERREYHRCPMRHGKRLRARVARFGGPESCGEVVDLSAGGVMIQTLPFLREGGLRLGAPRHAGQPLDGVWRGAPGTAAWRRIAVRDCLR